MFVFKHIFYMNTSTPESFEDEIRNEVRNAPSTPEECYNEIRYEDIHIDFDMFREICINSMDDYLERRFKPSSTRKISREETVKMFLDILKYKKTIKASTPKAITPIRAKQLICKFVVEVCRDNIVSRADVKYGMRTGVFHAMLINK